MTDLTGGACLTTTRCSPRGMAMLAQGDDAMKRRQLFEIEDIGWVPGSLRDTGTDLLRFATSLTKPYHRAFPRIVEEVKRSNTTHIVDLCSGGGGPIAQLATALDEAGLDVQITLTDLHPNRRAAQTMAGSSGWLAYEREPVDATAVPAHLTGFRTLFTSFHHFEPGAARKILVDAVEARQPIGIFELTQRKVPLMLFSLTNIPVALALTPFVRPFRLSRLLWTYSGFGPLLFWWDGMVSCMRSYTVGDLKAMVQGLPRNDYDWQIGIEPGRPAGITYLIGVPGGTS